MMKLPTKERLLEVLQRYLNFTASSNDVSVEYNKASSVTIAIPNFFTLFQGRYRTDSLIYDRNFFGRINVHPVFRNDSLILTYHFPVVQDSLIRLRSVRSFSFFSPIFLNTGTSNIEIGQVTIPVVVNPVDIYFDINEPYITVSHPQNITLHYTRRSVGNVPPQLDYYLVEGNSTLGARINPESGIICREIPTSNEITIQFTDLYNGPRDRIKIRVVATYRIGGRTVDVEDYVILQLPPTTATPPPPPPPPLQR